MFNDVDESWLRTFRNLRTTKISDVEIELAKAARNGDEFSSYLRKNCCGLFEESTKNNLAFIIKSYLLQKKKQQIAWKWVVRELHKNSKNINDGLHSVKRKFLDPCSNINHKVKEFFSKVNSFENVAASLKSKREKSWTFVDEKLIFKTLVCKFRYKIES